MKFKACKTDMTILILIECVSQKLMGLKHPQILTVVVFGGGACGKQAILGEILRLGHRNYEVTKRRKVAHLSYMLALGDSTA